jgi:DNA-directed RNA polymerase specialized sigma24 family protein
LKEFVVTDQEWTLTRSALEKLLGSLSDKPELAAERYEDLRRLLCKFFEWRGASYPEECTDETLNRVARKLEEGVIVQNISSYSYGIARLVFLEWSKGPDRKQVPLDVLTAAPAAPEQVTEESLELECFDECLKDLSAESREIIVQYYSEDKRAKIDNRNRLAARIGIPINALRSRAQRTRQKLERCIMECLKTRA